MADLLDEVLRDQSDEKKLYYFKKFLPYVISLTLIIAILMGAYTWQQNSRHAENAKLGDLLIKVVASETDEATRLELLDSIINKFNGRAIELAKLEQVSIKIGLKNYTEAKLILDEIIANHKYLQVSRDYARLIWISLAIDESNLSDSDRQKMDENLKHFNNEKQPFFASANMIKALWHIKNNQKDLAIDVLKKIIALDENTPVVIKDQAAGLLSTLVIFG
jgi:hypothetical protein